MSTYINEYCPFCKKNLTINRRSELHDYNRYIGLSYERCPYCKHIYSTNKKLYSDMNIEEKSNISSCYFFNIISSSFTIYSIVILIMILITDAVLKIDIGNILNYIFIAPILPCIILGYILARKNYNDIKNLTINDFEIDDELKEINVQNNYEEDEDLTELLKKLR